MGERELGDGPRSSLRDGTGFDCDRTRNHRGLEHGATLQRTLFAMHEWRRRRAGVRAACIFEGGIGEVRSVPRAATKRGGLGRRPPHSRAIGAVAGLEAAPVVGIGRRVDKTLARWVSVLCAREMQKTALRTRRRLVRRRRATRWRRPR